MVTLSGDGASLIAPPNLLGGGSVGGRTVRGARPGEAVILYGTGFGATNPPTLAGRILASGAPIASSATIRVGSDAAIADHTGRGGFVGFF